MNRPHIAACDSHYKRDNVHSLLFPQRNQADSIFLGLGRCGSLPAAGLGLNTRLVPTSNRRSSFTGSRSRPNKMMKVATARQRGLGGGAIESQQGDAAIHRMAVDDFHVVEMRLAQVDSGQAALRGH